MDLPNDMAQDFAEIVNVEVVVIADDSGSMMGSRWSELQATLTQLVDCLVMIDDTAGFELKFLNCNPPNDQFRKPGDHSSVQIHNRQDLERCWQWARPTGRTPLCETCQPFMRSEGMTAHSRLVLVFTDGEPNGGYDALARVIRSKPSNIGVGFMMCTTDDNVVEHYNQHFDKGIPGVDVNDDYDSEKREAEGKGQRLSYQRYLVKAMLGPLHAKYDMIDELNTDVHRVQDSYGAGKHKKNKKSKQDKNNGSCVVS